MHPAASEQLGRAADERVTDGRFRSDVQALRGLAILIVVAYHAEVLAPGGFVGVDVFFVISGFVIGQGLLTNFESNGWRSFGSFYLRRARRILPSLAVMLTLVALVSPLLAPMGADVSTQKTAVAAALLSANSMLLRITGNGYFDVRADLNPLLHTWSIAVEEQFYIVLPVAMWLAWWGGRRLTQPRRALQIVVVGLFFASLAGCFWFSFGGHFDQAEGLRVAFFSPFTRAWEFLAGVLIVLFPARRFMASNNVRVGMLVVGLGGIAAATRLFNDDTPYPGSAAILPVVGAVLVILAGSGVGRSWSGGGRTGPRMRAALVPVIKLGDLSYSWYLWHWPLIVFVGATWPRAGRAPLVAAAAFSLIPAEIARRVVENRFRFAKAPKTLPTLVLVAGCVAAPLLATVVAAHLRDEVATRPEVQAFRAAQAPHVANDTCDNLQPVGSPGRAQCTWGAPQVGASVVLVGDSNAGQFSEAFINATATDHLRFSLGMKSSCPFIDATVEAPIAEPGCREFVAASIDNLINDPPDLVVIANATDRYVFWDGSKMVDPATGRRTSGEQENAKVFEQALRRTVSRLTSAGIKVVVLKVTPKPWAAGLEIDTRSCSAYVVIVSPDRCAHGTFDAAGRIISRTHEIEQRAATRGGGTTWDLSAHLCPSGSCSLRSGSTLTWAEPLHISPVASLALAPPIAELLRTATAPEK